MYQVINIHEILVQYITLYKETFLLIIYTWILPFKIDLTSFSIKNFASKRALFFRSSGSQGNRPEKLKFLLSFLLNNISAD